MRFDDLTGEPYPALLNPRDERLYLILQLMRNLNCPLKKMSLKITLKRYLR